MDKQNLTLDDVAEKLRARFSDDVHKYRVGNTWENGRGGRSGRVLTYIDARDVMERLDDVVGPGGWETHVRPTNVPGAFVCELTILGVTKSAVGQAGDGESEKEKSGESDALKRAAVYFGIGRYLYSVDLPPVELVQRGNKWDLPRGWRPGMSVAAAPPTPPSTSHQRDTHNAGNGDGAGASSPAPAPVYGATDAGVRLRAPSRHKLFPSKVNAVKARARAELGWSEETLVRAVQKWYGAPTIEDLQQGEFTELMDMKIAQAKAAIEAKQTA